MAVLALGASPARAVTTCTASATPLSFGTVTGAAPVDSSAIVSVQCNTTALLLLGSARVRMCLNIGSGAAGGGQTAPRRMLNAFSDPLQFQMYTDPARTQVWGSTDTPATPSPVLLDLQYPVPIIGGSGTVQRQIHGRVFAQAGLASGSFSNPFTGSHTRLDYRYNESIFGSQFPASCTSGGNGGGSITFPFTASAQVASNCVINTAAALDFGVVPGAIAENREQTSLMTFTCTGRTAWQVGLDDGQHAVGAVRRMQRTGDTGFVDYQLFRDPGFTQRWGSTLDVDTVPGTGSGAQQSLTIYGRVPAPQSVPAGEYRDVITVTITF